MVLNLQKTPHYHLQKAERSSESLEPSKLGTSLYVRGIGHNIIIALKANGGTATWCTHGMYQEPTSQGTCMPSVYSKGFVMGQTQMVEPQ